MKKLTIFILLFTFIVSVFSACTENADQSSEVTSSEAAVSENSATKDTESSEPIESSEPPAIDMSKVLYNPDSFCGGMYDAALWYFWERLHIGLSDYIDSNKAPDDAYYCVELTNHSGEITQTGETFTEYLEKIGFIIDDDLTTAMNTAEALLTPEKKQEGCFADPPLACPGICVRGYITAEGFKKMESDNYAIECTWLALGCLDGFHGGNKKNGGVYCDPESSEPSTGEINIPEFDINNLLYCDMCALELKPAIVEPDNGYHGARESDHNGDLLEAYIEENKDTISDDAYLYMIFMQYSGKSDENPSPKPLNELLEEYGYTENEEKTQLAVDSELYSDVTAGYMPYVTLESFFEDCRTNGYDIYYSWMSENCLGESCWLATGIV